MGVSQTFFFFGLVRPRTSIFLISTSILETGCVTPPELFLLQFALSVWSFLWFHMSFRIAFSISMNNAFGIFIGIAFHLQTSWGSMNILLILPIPEYERAFLLFVSSSAYLINVL
jgi:hypothetical protein